jgi:hypothetical protein
MCLNESITMEFFIDACSECETIRHGKRDYLFPHLINTICPKCKLSQTLNKIDYELKNRIRLDLTQMLIYHEYSNDPNSTIEKCFFLYDEDSSSIDDSFSNKSTFIFRCQLHEHELIIKHWLEYLIAPNPFMVSIIDNSLTYPLIYRAYETDHKLWCYSYKNSLGISDTIFIEKPIPGNQYQWNQSHKEGEEPAK